MSQKGASRWARGDQEYCINAGYCSGKVDAPWSVSLQQYNQILTHYYTGIQIRSIYSPYAPTTPNDRWVPLEIEWDFLKEAPKSLCRGKTHIAKITVQNTGTTTWYANGADRYEFLYTLAGVPMNPQLTAKPRSNIAPGGVFNVVMGVTVPSNLPGDGAILSFSMKKNGAPFTNWWAYSLGNLTFSTGNCKHNVFFPNTIRGTAGGMPMH